MPQIFVLSGADVGRSFDVRAGDSLGRSPECVVTLKDASISRRHARLEQVDGEWFLVDEGSRNGIDAGAGRVKRAHLVDRMEVRLGEVLVRFRTESASAPAAGSSTIPSSPGAMAPARPASPQPPAPPRAPSPGPGEPAPQPFDAGRTAYMRPLTPAPQPPRRLEHPAADDEILLEGPDEPLGEPARFAARAASGPGPGEALPGGVGGGAGRSGADLGRASREQGRILQYHKVEGDAGLMGAELGQYPIWLRLGLYALAAALAAGLAWLAFKTTWMARGTQASPPSMEEEPDNG